MSLSIDLDALIRRWRPDKHTRHLVPRNLDKLVSAADILASRRMFLVPDTTVYIHNAAGTLPGAVAALLDAALQWHCAVCLAEITTGIANLDPAAIGWVAIEDTYAAVLDSIPGSRILVPDGATWLAAGFVTGTLARTQRLQRQQRKELLNDALIYLTAAKAGLPVLTANRGEFDLLQQVAGTGSFIHYAAI